MPSPFFVGIVAAPNCFVDTDNNPISGTLFITPSSNFALPVTNQQVTGDTVSYPISNGGLPTASPIQLPNPAFTSPSGIGYTFVIEARNQTTKMVFANVLVVPDVAGNFDLGKLNTGQFVPAVPTTIISLSSLGVAGTAANPTVTVSTGSAPVLGFLFVAMVNGVAVVRGSDSPPILAPLFGISVASSGPFSALPVQTSGTVTNAQWNWAMTPGAPIMLGVGGALTQTPPPLGEGYTLQIVGIPLNPTTLFISIQTPLHLN